MPSPRRERRPRAVPTGGHGRCRCRWCPTEPRPLGTPPDTAFAREHLFGGLRPPLAGAVLLRWVLRPERLHRVDDAPRRVDLGVAREQRLVTEEDIEDQ